MKHRNTMRRNSVKLGKMIRICPGERHAWFESSIGPVRKPLAST